MSEAEIRSLRDLAERLRASATDLGEGYFNDGKGRRHEALLAEARENSEFWDRLPAFLRNYSTGAALQRYLKTEHGTYRGRGQFIAEQLKPTMDWLDSQLDTAMPAVVISELANAPSQYIREHIQKAMERAGTDPSGVLTSTRSLVESVCAHVLTAKGEPLLKEENLPAMFKRAAKTLGLTPESDGDENLRKMIQGCVTALDGLGCLRNDRGDGHGRPDGHPEALNREANLAICLAAGTSWFLLRSLEADSYKDEL